MIGFVNHGNFYRQVNKFVCNIRLRLAVTHLGMYAKIFTTGEPNAVEIPFFRSLFFRLGTRYTIVHESLKLSKGLFDFGDGTRAINQLSFSGIKLLHNVQSVVDMSYVYAYLLV